MPSPPLTFPICLEWTMDDNGSTSGLQQSAGEILLTKKSHPEAEACFRLWEAIASIEFHPATPRSHCSFSPPRELSHLDSGRWIEPS